MKNIYIVGGNGFAKECVAYINAINAFDKSIKLGGLVGHNGYRVDFGTLDKFFVGDLRDQKFGQDDYCVIGAGYPELRRKIYDDIVAHGGKFYNLCYNCSADGGRYYGDTFMPEGFEHGRGNIFISCKLMPNVGITVGNGNVFNGGVIIGHDDKIGDFNFFGARNQILGTVSIGNDNTIGANAILMPHAKIGNNNKVSPLSVVYKGCKDNNTLHGNPALKI
jgi:acetyltransferase-like isoleucine patch superfamily enzyme